MNHKDYMDMIRRDQLRRLNINNGTTALNPGINFVAKDSVPQEIPQTEPVTEKQPEPQMPSLLEMGKNLVKTAADVAKGAVTGQGLNLTEEEKNARLSICESCEFYNAAQSRCTKCGCYMAVKTYLKAATCPVGKW